MELEKKRELGAVGRVEKEHECDGLEKDDAKPVADSPDLLPENCRYYDEGCELAASCLNCPFDSCVYDKRGGKLKLARNERDKEIARLYFENSKSTEEIAGICGVSLRTVQRALNKVKKNGRSMKKGSEE